MKSILLIGLLIIYMMSPCNAQDEPGESITESYQLEAASGSEGVISRSLTAKIRQSSDSTTINLSAWKGDCSLSIMSDSRSRVFRRDDGNLEWEIILTEPQIAPLTYTITVQRLTCYHQPELTPDELAEGCYRPDSVAGSYAFYHASGRNDRINANGKDTTITCYGTGKVFHIYAPYAWDMTGDTTKCSLYIDIQKKSLEIHLPNEFLKTAVYPVTVDPQFGKTDIGASQMLLGTSYSSATLFACPENGALDSFAVYISEDGIPGTVGAAIYDDDSGCDGLRDSTSVTVVTATGTAGWYQLKAAEEAEVHSGDNYWLAAFCGGSPFNLRYDSYSGAQTIRSYSDPWPPPDPCSNPTWNHPDRLVSIYAVYTTGESEDESIFRRRMLMITREGVND